MQTDESQSSLSDLFRMVGLCFGGIIAAEALSGCIVAGVSSSGGFFLWPGSIGLVLVILLVGYLLSRGR